MHLIKTRFGLDLARNDRRDVLTTVEARAARVVAIARLLPPGDRRLVELIFVRGQSYRMAAAQIGLSSGTVTRQVRRLRNLLASPTTRAIAEHVETLAPPARQIAVDHFFGRMGVAAIGRKHDLPRRVAQSKLDFIRGWARALHRHAVLDATHQTAMAE